MTPLEKALQEEGRVNYCDECEDCQFVRLQINEVQGYYFQYCCITRTTIFNCDGKRMDNCPLVELPAQHGRLIDEHAFLLTENNSNAWTLDEFAHLMVAVKSSPTIIEAEWAEG